jgi:hypothetical protein
MLVVTKQSNSWEHKSRTYRSRILPRFMELKILLPCSQDYTTWHHYPWDKSSPYIPTIPLRYILVLISDLNSIHSSSVFLPDFLTKIFDALLTSRTYYMQLYLISLHVDGPQISFREK